MTIPKPLCRCRICREAREKGPPYSRSGPALFIHDENMLIDTPAEICGQLNGSDIQRIDYLLFTHLDPDHVEGFRVVEQVSLDFRSWQAYPNKQIQLMLPEQLYARVKGIQTIYVPAIDFYEAQGFIACRTFDWRTSAGRINITALPVNRGGQVSFIYIFTQQGHRVVYAPCDIKPFPEDRKEVQNADLLIIQAGIFEQGLKHGFTYEPEHISRSTLYTFEETLALAKRIHARRVLFVHLEEYWNRSYDDYLAIEKEFTNIHFAYDNMQISV